MSDLLSLESDVLAKLLEGDEPVLARLREQLTQAQVSARQYTGKGFFVDLIVDETMALSDKPDFTIGDVEAVIPGLDNGAGFVLFVKRGLLTVLEGYCYGETWPNQVMTFRLHYIKHGQPSSERDRDALHKELGL